jgi:hypothetical protein
MSELVTRLRDVGESDDPLSVNAPERVLRLEAADEIERLRAERDDAREAALVYRAIVREAYLIDIEGWIERWPWLEVSDE